MQLLVCFSEVVVAKKEKEEKQRKKLLKLQLSLLFPSSSISSCSAIDSMCSHIARDEQLQLTISRETTIDERMTRMASSRGGWDGTSVEQSYYRQGA